LDIFADYHTHTVYSHGKGTIEDNVREARSKGLGELAITDHGPGHFLYGVSRKDLQKMREEVDRLNGKYGDIRVLLGVEANVISLDGGLDVDGDIISMLDILLVGYHFGALPATLRDGYHIHFKNFVGRWTSPQRVRENNTKALIKAIQKYPVSIITHPGAKADIDTKVLAGAAAEKGVALEINASHHFMTEDYVRIAKAEGARFVLGSDAHTPRRVGDVKAAVEVALKAGLTPGDIINVKEEGGKV
jgi:putative hydrolase